MNQSLSEMDLADALFRTIAHVIDEFHQKGLLSADEHTILIDSVWHELDYGSRLPK